MPKTQNPMFNFDFTKVMADFDPAKMAEEFTKLAGQYKLPAVDVESLLENQRKNLDALTAANRSAVEGMQAVAQRQGELLQESFDTASAAIDDLTKSASPQEAAEKQTDLFKLATETALSNMRELAEMVAKSNTEATQAINVRIAEQFEDIKSQATGAKAK